MADEKTPDELAEQAKAAKAVAEATELLTARQKALEEQGGLTRKQLNDINSSLREQLNSYTDINSITDEYRAVISTLASVEADLARAQGEGNKVLEAQLLSLKKTNEERKESLEVKSANAKADKKIVPGLKELGEELISNTKLTAENTKKRSEAQLALDRLSDSETRSGLALNSFSKALSVAKMQEADFSAGGMDMVGTLAEIGFKFDAASKAVEVNTGLGRQSVEQMKSLVSENYELGVTTEEASKAISTLNSQYGGFIGANQATQKELANTVLQLERLGVSSESSAKALDLLDRGFGMGADGAREALDEFDKLAQGLSLPTSQVVDDFTKIGPQLARFGKQGTKQFASLSKQARSLGLNIEDAFNIAEAMDTFEGAADMAGKLNAQLGLQINSVDMLGATHEQRIEMLRQEFKQSGQNFDQLDRRQKQAVAEMMGVSVDVAGKLFGDPVKYKQYQKDQEEAAARAERLTAVQTKLAAIGDRLMVAFGPVLTLFSGLANILSYGYIPHAIALFTGFIGVLKTLSMVKLAVAAAEQMGVASTKSSILARTAENAKTLIGIGLDKIKGFFRLKEIADTQRSIGMKIIENEVEEELNDTKKESVKQSGNSGMAAMKLIPIMLALGAAVLMVGAGIYLAATGMANFVDAFAKLSMEQIVAFGFGLVGLAIGLYMLIPALASFATSLVLLGGGAAIAGLLALGLALMMIGAGIGMIAAGAGAAFEGISNVLETSSTVSPANMKATMQVLDKMIDVQVASAFVPALTAIADSVMFGGDDTPGGERSSEKTIELKVNERILGNVVVDIMNNRYDLTPR